VLRNAEKEIRKKLKRIIKIRLTYLRYKINYVKDCELNNHVISGYF